MCDVLQDLQDYTFAQKLGLEADSILSGTIDQGHSLYVLGGIQYDTDNYRGAIDLFEKAVALLTAPENQERLALVLNGISLCWMELGQLQSALEVRVREMEITEKVYGVEHPEYATRYQREDDGGPLTIPP